MTLTVGSIITVTAHELDFLGQGVARYDDLVVFVKGLITNESAEVEVTQIKKRFVSAKIKTLITKSGQRKDVLSVYGAQDLYHLSDNAQLDWQIQITKNAFKRQFEDVSFNEILTGNQQLNYRNKVVYHIMNQEKLQLGLYDDRSTKLISIDDFKLAAESLTPILLKLDQSGIKIDPLIFKQIVFRNNQNGEILVTLVATKKKFFGLKQLIELFSGFSQIVGLTLNLKKHPKNILSDESTVLFGKNELMMKLDDFKLLINDQAFFQINDEVMLKTYHKITEFIGRDGVIDAYSGVGSIGLLAAKKASQVILIESNTANNLMAKQNISLNDYLNIVLHEAKVEDVLADIKAEVLIVDPPRSGLHESLSAKIVEKQFSKIAYLSCELKTLVRDLIELTKVYEIKEVIPVRMFPQTTSIETLVLLELKSKD